MKPIISVVMPVYNSEKYLRESIESILNQTLFAFEFIIVNDCSTDDSLKIIKSYKDKRIKIINNKKNLHSVKSRNIGLKAAKGTYIAMMDSDDVSDRQRLVTQCNYLEKNPHIFLVGSSAIFIDEDGRETKRFRKYDDYKMLAWRMPVSCGIIHSSIMFKNGRGARYNEFYTSAHDYNLYLDLLEEGKHLSNHPKFLVKHREHSQSHHENTERQVLFSKATQKIHEHLNKPIGFFTQMKYITKLGFFFIRTYKEKKGK